MTQLETLKVATKVAEVTRAELIRFCESEAESQSLSIREAASMCGFALKLLTYLMVQDKIILKQKD